VLLDATERAVMIMQQSLDAPVVYVPVGIVIPNEDDTEYIA
jgi:hypothetical protein